MKIILASSSPRRREILQSLNVPFTTINPDYEESAHAYRGNPSAYVEEIAIEKAKSLELSDEYLLIAADTVVALDGAVFGKPASYEKGFAMLKELSGKTHRVFTAVAVREKGNISSCVQHTDVEMAMLSDRQMAAYLQSIEYRDKAGSYAIQGKGALIVKEIRGCFYNVMGLPIQSLETLLNQYRMSLWDYLVS